MTKAARRAEHEAPHDADGPSRQGLPVRRARRNGDAARPVRRTPSADRPALHVRPELGRRLPELHRRHPTRLSRRTAPAFARPRHDAGGRVAGAAREDREATSAQRGWDVPVVLVVRQRLQLRLPRHPRRVGRAGRVQLPRPRRTEGARHSDGRWKDRPSSRATARSSTSTARCSTPTRSSPEAPSGSAAPTRSSTSRLSAARRSGRSRRVVPTRRAGQCPTSRPDRSRHCIGHVTASSRSLIICRVIASVTNSCTLPVFRSC